MPRFPICVKEITPGLLTITSRIDIMSSSEVYVDTARGYQILQVFVEGSMSNTEGLKPSHLGIVVENAQETSRILSSLWKIGPWTIRDYTAPKEAMIVGDPFRLKLMYTKFEDITVELLEPVEGKSIWADFLMTQGGGLHHIAFKVSDYEASVAEIEAQGGKLLVSAGFGSSRWSYFDVPPSKVIVELMDNYEI
jgi:methylmalonyl-CoA/ethylmalonyl-CoA epimerase